MQHIHYILISLLALALSSCSDNDDNAPEGTLTVSKKQMTVSVSNFDGEPVEINASDYWTATVSDSWILLSQTTGEAGTTTLKVYVDNSAIDETENGYTGKITLALADNPDIMTEIAILREEENGYDYPTLYTLNVQHDYFEGTANTAFGCRLSTQGVETARRLNLLFRQTAVNEWSVFFDQNSTLLGTDDVLSLELALADPQFALYTDWQNFNSSAAYKLELFGTETELEATNAIQLSGGSKPAGSGFCSVSLHLTDEMRRTALENQPVKTYLHFPARSVKWEYIFIARDGQNISGNNMKLEDLKGKIAFGEMKTITAYGRECFATTSVERIPMRVSYDCRLRLMQLQSDKPNRIVLANIPLPIPERFISEDNNVLRQICYY